MKIRELLLYEFSPADPAQGMEKPNSLSNPVAPVGAVQPMIPTTTPVSSQTVRAAVINKTHGPDEEQQQQAAAPAPTAQPMQQQPMQPVLPGQAPGNPAEQPPTGQEPADPLAGMMLEPQTPKY